MRQLFFLCLLLTAACERVSIVESSLEGDGLEPTYEDPEPGKAPTSWTIEDDWHRVLLVVRAGPDRTRLFVRTFSDPDTTPRGVWWEGEAYRVRLSANTQCDSSLEYFDNPGNSFANNFLSPGYPNIYSYSTPTSEPDVAAILIVTNCLEQDIGIMVTVLDDTGEAAREHQLTLRATEVDWYYNPLILN